MHAWRFWATARDYWQPGQSRIAWPLTISMTAVVLASLTIICGLNLWNRRFFGALQAKNTAVALHQALLFPLLVGGYLAICIFAMWARMTMQRTWRAFVNDRLVDKWLKRSRYYQLELIDGDHKNPEHRIKDDVRIATEMPVDFVTGFITAVLSAATFFVVLSSVGGAITLPFAGGIVLPGYILFIRRPALLRDCQWGRCWRSVASSCAPPRPKTKPKRNTAIRSLAFGKMPNASRCCTAAKPSAPRSQELRQLAGALDRSDCTTDAGGHRFARTRSGGRHCAAVVVCAALSRR